MKLLHAQFWLQHDILSNYNFLQKPQFWGQYSILSHIHILFLYYLLSLSLSLSVTSFTFNLLRLTVNNCRYITTQKCTDFGHSQTRLSNRFTEKDTCLTFRSQSSVHRIHDNVEFLTLQVRNSICLSQRSSPYRAVNTLRLGYTNQSVNVV